MAAVSAGIYLGGENDAIPLTFLLAMVYNKRHAGMMELADVTDSKSCSSIHRRFCRTLGITAYFQLSNSIWF